MQEIPQPYVYIVILNWNGWEDSHACIQSVRKSEYSNYKIILVDNASTDESVRNFIDLGYSEILAISDENLGFAGGCNIGIKAAIKDGADFIWLLNNDTLVEPQTLYEMIKTACKNSFAATGSVIFEMDNPSKVQAWGGGSYSNYTGSNWNNKFKGKLKFITGASILISREAIEIVGLIDEDYFMYWEDIDYGRRILNAGLTLGVSEQSHILHAYEASAGKVNEQKYKWRGESLVLFYRKHSAFPLIPILIGLCARLAKRVIAKDYIGARKMYEGAKSAYEKPLSAGNHITK